MGKTKRNLLTPWTKWLSLPTLRGYYKCENIQ